MKKRQPGDPLAIAATEWNEIVDATNIVIASRQRGGGPVFCSRNYLVNGSDIILGTGPECDQFDAVTLGAITPDISNPDWHQKIAVNIGFPTGERCEIIGVCQEAFKAGEYGRIMVGGVSPVKIDMQDDDDDIAIGDGTGTLTSRGTTQSEKPGGQGVKIVYGKEADGYALVQLGQVESCHATMYTGAIKEEIAEDDDPAEAIIKDLAGVNGKKTTEEELTAKNSFKFNANEDALALIVWHEPATSSGDGYWLLIQVECP